MPRISEQQLTALRQALYQDSQFDLDYIVLCVAACAIASCGLLVGSSAVIIGAMIVAPLMLPMRGLALGALEGDVVLFRSSLLSVAISISLAITISGAIGGVAGIPASEFTAEILARTRPTLVDLAIAIAAGVIAGFAKIRPQVSDALAGTAIAVALMPPLCVVGIALSQDNPGYAQGAFLLYLTNLLGITLSCMTVFAISGYYIQGSKVTRALSSTIALTGALVIPLSFGLRNLIQQVQIQATLRETLVRRTITVGQQVELLSTDIDWQQSPPHVYLRVRTNPDQPLTPIQVVAVEELIRQTMGRHFKLIFQVEEYKEITTDDYLEAPVLNSTPNLSQN